MIQFEKILDNYVFWVAIVSWLSAQVLKALFYAIRKREFSIERLMGAGGMPSSHTATVCGLTMAVARAHGLDSPMFAISLVLTGIVMYDASGVRRAAGEQAKIINKMVLEHKKNPDFHIDAQKTLKELLGHTPLEVFGGAVLGIGIALMMPM